MKKKAALPSANEQQLLQQLIVFRIEDEEFGIPIEAVQEIIKVGMITPIPDSPAFIQGLINVRGDIVAVINLKARFFISSDEGIAKHIVIAKQPESLFGIMVDEVIEVLRIQEADIKPPPHLMSQIHEDYVHGVLTHEGRLIILLDLSKILSEDELSRLAESARTHFRKDMEDDHEEIIDERTAVTPSEASHHRPKKTKEKNRNPS